MPATARHQRLRRRGVCRYDQGAAVGNGGITPVNLVCQKKTVGAVTGGQSARRCNQ